MKFFKAIKTNHLRNEAHLQFMLLLKQLIDTTAAVKAVVERYYPSFVALLDREETLVDLSKKSEYTDRISAADSHVDNIITGINRTIDAALHHFDPDVADAAKVLHDMMKPFGRVAKKPYEEESAAVKVMLDDLTGKYAVQSQKLGLTPWLTELAAAQDEFETLVNERNIEYSERPKDNTQALRNEVDVEYYNILERVDAAAVFNGETAYQAFIDQWNSRIDYFNEHEIHHHRRYDIANARVGAIADIPYNGQPATPMPVIHYIKADGTVETLVFERDFSLVYKHNDRPGTAQTVIHGKGTYKGSIEVTFNIV
ncbi:MAG: DUF6261 family protein [Prevotellaceae bacterium]|jgi:hypothetical protein|nr:DUF6261 family protein [Prevotellaceae bacterium]